MLIFILYFAYQYLTLTKKYDAEMNASRGDEKMPLYDIIKRPCIFILYLCIMDKYLMVLLIIFDYDTKCIKEIL